MNSNVFEWSVKNKIATLKASKELIKLDLNLWIETMTKDDWQEYPRFMRWREKHQEWYPSQFLLSKDGTINWYNEQVFKREDRILFWVCCNQGKLGHIGLSRFNWEEQSCELDNILRGNDYEPGAMTKSINWLINLARNHLLVRKIYLRTFADNYKAMKLYKSCGFHSLKKVPSRRVVTGDRVDYIEDPEGRNRHYLYMEYRK